jgi:penicillin-insensitive murein endopeptidase
MDRRGVAADGIRWLAIAFLLIFGGTAAATDRVARLAFGGASEASAGQPEVIGSYVRGCLAGGARLPDIGNGFQTMRPSRNRAWGHPELLTFLKDLSSSLVFEKFRPILVGDMSQPRGGPMKSGHKSHQIGIDADIWFRPGRTNPLTRKQRESWSAETVVKSVRAPWVNEKFTDREARMVELAARDRRTARIFVAAPIKKALCEANSPESRGWLRKVRPWWGHVYHMHVRLNCPGGSGACKAQKPPPPGDGCGKELSSWLKPPKAKKPSTKPKKPKKPKKKREIMLSQLPAGCTDVLDDRSRR